LSSSRSSRRRALDGAVDQGERIVAHETQRLRRCQRIVAVLGAPRADGLGEGDQRAVADGRAAVAQQHVAAQPLLGVPDDFGPVLHDRVSPKAGRLANRSMHKHYVIETFLSIENDICSFQAQSIVSDPKGPSGCVQPSGEPRIAHVLGLALERQHTAVGLAAEHLEAAQTEAFDMRPELGVADGVGQRRAQPAQFLVAARGGGDERQARRRQRRRQDADRTGEFRYLPLDQVEADGVDGGDVGLARRHRAERFEMAAGGHDLGEIAHLAGTLRRGEGLRHGLAGVIGDQSAEGVVTGMRGRLVDRRDLALELGQAGNAGTGADDDQRSVRGTLDEGGGIGRRRDQAHRPGQPFHQRIAAGLAEQQGRRAPLLVLG
jgi:hypothetical protein